MTDSLWRSAHVHYHDDPSGLLVDAVRPLLDRLRDADGVRRAYWTRHWRLGPHIRINVDATPEAHQHQVWPAVATVVGEYLREHPSTTQLDPQALAEVHRQLAHHEEDSGPLTPWRPNNSVVETDYEDRSAVLTETLANLAIDFYCDTNGMALGSLNAAPGHRQRLSLAFDLLTATAHQFAEQGLRWGAASLRAHSEGIRREPHGPTLLRRWEGTFADNTAALTGRARTITSALDEATIADLPHVHRWVSHLGRFHDRIVDYVDQGRISRNNPILGDPGGKPLLTTILRHSELVRLGAASPGYQAIGRTTWYHAYRICLNLLFLHLARLGLTQLDRLSICYLVARASEEIHQTSFLQLLSQPPRPNDAPNRPGSATPRTRSEVDARPEARAGR
jgi:Lantibiotic biosynthesis dehydratase C-term